MVLRLFTRGATNWNGSLLPTNRILAQLPARERAALLAEAEIIHLSAGSTLAVPGEPISAAYFPDSGVISYVSEMRTGRQAAVAAIGVDGLIGVGALLGVARHPYRVTALLDSGGYRMTPDALRRAFEDSRSFRTAVLEHIGRLLIEITSLVACSRVHSHRQRLARWLLMTTDKAQRSSLGMTHDVLAQMMGGQRHAVTVALNELRAKGAIAHLRGRIDVLDRSILIAHACECYDRRTNLSDSAQSRP